MLPLAFRFLETFLPATKPQEGWRSLQVTGFGLVWPPKSFFIRFRSCRRAALKCFRAAAACHQAPRRVAKPGFGLVWPPKSFFIGFRTCRRAGFKCFRAAAACHQTPRWVAEPGKSFSIGIRTCRWAGFKCFRAAAACYVGGVVGWISNATGLPGALEAAPPCSRQGCVLSLGAGAGLSGLGGITLPVAGGDGA